MNLITFLKDSAKECKFYFRNTTVVVMHDGFGNVGIRTEDALEYSEKEITNLPIRFINFDFNFGLAFTPKSKSEFYTFLESATRNEAERTASLMGVIGYLLHNHNLPYFHKLVLFSGYGKSLIAKAIGMVKRTFGYNAQHLDSRYMANLSRNQVCFYDEATLDTLSIMTYIIKEGFNANEKLKEVEYISPSELPKLICLSTERILIPHYDKRIIFVNLFHEINSGSILFEKWTYEQWNDFYLQMIRCVCIYFASFKDEVPTIEIPNENLLNLNVSDLIL